MCSLHSLLLYILRFSILASLLVLCTLKLEPEDRVSFNDGQIVSFLTLNVGFPKSGYSSSINGLAKLLLDADADIVFISEAYGESGDSLYSLIKPFYQYSSYEWGGASHCLFCKMPFRWNHRVAREIDPHAFVCRFYVQIDEDEVSLYCCHLSSNNIHEDGSYISYRDMSGISGKLKYYRNYRRVSSIRAQMVDSIIADIDRNFVVVMGDMNDVVSSKALSQLSAKGFTNSWIENGKGKGYTIYKPIPLRIDHLYYKNFLPRRTIVIPTEGLSDHNALMVELVMK